MENKIAVEGSWSKLAEAGLLYLKDEVAGLTGPQKQIIRRAVSRLGRLSLEASLHPNQATIQRILRERDATEATLLSLGEAKAATIWNGILKFTKEGLQFGLDVVLSGIPTLR